MPKKVHFGNPFFLKSLKSSQKIYNSRYAQVKNEKFCMIANGKSDDWLSEKKILVDLFAHL